MLLEAAHAAILISLVPIIQMRGDRALLLRVNNARENNAQKILDWKGSAVVKDYRRKTDSLEHFTENHVEFVFSRKFPATRWNWNLDFTESRSTSPEGVVTRQRTQSSYFRNGMKKDGVLYVFDGAPPRGAERATSLIVRPVEHARHSFSARGFDPMWYLEKGGKKISPKLLFYHREFDNPDIIPGSVLQDGDIIILKISDGVGLNEHRFNIRQGGNLVAYVAGDSSERAETLQTYESHKGVWLPKTYVRTMSRREGEDDELVVMRKREVVFNNTIINVPLKESNFSLETLGLQKGDTVTDSRTGITTIYQGEAQRDGP